MKTTFGAQSSLDPHLPCSTRTSHRRYPRASQGRYRAAGADSARTPLLPPSEAGWLLSCPSHPYALQNGLSADKQSTGTCALKQRTLEISSVTCWAGRTAESDRSCTPSAARRSSVLSWHMPHPAYGAAAARQLPLQPPTSSSKKYCLKYSLAISLLSSNTGMMI